MLSPREHAHSKKAKSKKRLFENTHTNKSYSCTCRGNIQYQIFELTNAKWILSHPKTFAKGRLRIFNRHISPPRVPRDFLLARISSQGPPSRNFHPFCETM